MVVICFLMVGVCGIGGGRELGLGRRRYVSVSVVLSVRVSVVVSAFRSPGLFGSVVGVGGGDGGGGGGDGVVSRLSVTALRACCWLSSAPVILKAAHLGVVVIVCPLA